MGDGESSSVGRGIQPLWKLRETGLAVPSPVGRERVRVRVVLFELRLLSGTCFCTNPKAQNGARLPGFAIRISVLRVCFGFRVSDFGFWARSRSLCGTILKTRKLFLHER